MFAQIVKLGNSYVLAMFTTILICVCIPLYWFVHLVIEAVLSCKELLNLILEVVRTGNRDAFKVFLKNNPFESITDIRDDEG